VPEQYQSGQTPAASLRGVEGGVIGHEPLGVVEEVAAPVVIARPQILGR